MGYVVSELVMQDKLKSFLLYLSKLVSLGFFLSCSLSGLPSQAGYFLCLVVEATIVSLTCSSQLRTGL